MTAQVVQSAALTLLVYMCLMYLVGLLARDNSLVDIAYGPAFVVAGWSAWWQAGAEAQFRPLLLLVLVTLWGVRLGLHLGIRHRGRGEDFRYRQFREAWGTTILWRSFLQIYLLQGAVVLVILTPGQEHRQAAGKHHRAEQGAASTFSGRAGMLRMRAPQAL